MRDNQKQKLTALVTAVGGRSVGYQIFECLKKFPKNYRIVATDADPFAAGLYEADRGYLLPPSTTKSYIPKILEICKKEKIEVVLPGSIPETLEISKNEKKFDEMFKDLNNYFKPISKKKLALTDKIISEFF